MARAIHVRLDEQSEAALGALRAVGLNDSEAVRLALRESGERRRTRASLAAEAAALAADPQDRAEKQAITELMDELAPTFTD